jgi:hypothetical protein
MTVPPAPLPRRSSPFLRHLRAALLADLEPELLLCEKIAVLLAAGCRRSEIARSLDATPAALRAAEARVKSAADRLDLGDDG